MTIRVVQEADGDTNYKEGSRLPREAGEGAQSEGRHSRGCGNAENWTSKSPGAHGHRLGDVGGNQKPGPCSRAPGPATEMGLARGMGRLAQE